MPMVHQVPQIELRTNANGEMKDWEVKLDMLGDWRALVKCGDTTIAKRLSFQSKVVSGPLWTPSSLILAEWAVTEPKIDDKGRGQCQFVLIRFGTKWSHTSVLCLSVSLIRKD
jgi:hypothetical protein